MMRFIHILNHKINLLILIKKLWLLEQTNQPIIDIMNIVGQCIIWLEDNDISSLHYDFSVSEIIHKFDNQWKIHNINPHHQYPIEYLDLYYVDFGTFRNTYHSLGGV